MKAIVALLSTAALASLSIAACVKIGGVANRQFTCYPDTPRYFYLWVGPADEAPVECPDWASRKLFDVGADAVAGSFECPACACAPSNTECGYPTDWSAVARGCDEPRGANDVFFGAPDNWTGACSNQANMPPNLDCGGGEPCAQSMIVAAPKAAAQPCVPETSGEPGEPEPWGWATAGLGCVESEPLDPRECESGSKMRFMPPDGFLICTEKTGEICPALVLVGASTSESIEFTLYADAEDHRTCSPCGCGEPAGNACSVEVSVHSDAACVNEVGSAVVASDDSDDEVCFDLPDGTALAGKRAKVLDVTPGTCTPTGGEIHGEVEPTQPVRFCCEKYD